MDPLTHTLTGLALSRAGLRRVSAYATPILLMAASVPDLDVASLAAGEDAHLHFHRYFTHTFVAIPLLALLPVLVVRLFARKPIGWKGAYLVSLIGALSHLLLDWMNPYGIRFLLPFSSQWYRLDITSLVDVWIWAVLLLAAAAPLLSRLVSSEIGARSGSGRGIAIFALSFLLVYAFGRHLMHERAIETLNARLYAGEPPARVAALPTAFNPLRWTGLVEITQGYIVFEMNLLGQFDPAAGRLLYKPEPNPRETAAAAAARRTEAFRAFLEFSQYPYWRFAPAEQVPDGVRVQVMDLRFGVPPRPEFMATAIVDGSGRVIESDFKYDPPPDR